MDLTGCGLKHSSETMVCARIVGFTGWERLVGELFGIVGVDKCRWRVEFRGSLVFTGLIEVAFDHGDGLWRMFAKAFGC